MALDRKDLKDDKPIAKSPVLKYLNAAALTPAPPVAIVTDYKKLYGEDPVTQFPRKKPDEKKILAFKNQVNKLLETYKAWVKTNAKNANDQKVITQNIELLRTRIFGKDTEKETDMFFEVIKQNLESIYTQLNNTNYPLEKRLKALAKLSGEFSMCGPGLFTHIDATAEALNPDFSIERCLAQCRTRIIDVFASNYIDKYKIFEGNQIHVNKSLYKLALMENLNPSATNLEDEHHNLTNLDNDWVSKTKGQKDDFFKNPNNRNRIEFNQFFAEEYTPNLMVDNLVASFNEKLSNIYAMHNPKQELKIVKYLDNADGEIQRFEDPLLERNDIKELLEKKDIKKLSEIKEIKDLLDRKVIRFETMTPYHQKLYEDIVTLVTKGGIYSDTPSKSILRLADNSLHFKIDQDFLRARIIEYCKDKKMFSSDFVDYNNKLYFVNDYIPKDLTEFKKNKILPPELIALVSLDEVLSENLKEQIRKNERYKSSAQDFEQAFKVPASYHAAFNAVSDKDLMMLIPTYSNINLNQIYPNGKSLMAMALTDKKPSFELVESMLKNGANINLKTQGLTPLQTFITHFTGDSKNTDKFLKLFFQAKGIDFETKSDPDQKTALHFAVKPIGRTSDLNVVQQLINKKVNLNAKDISGYTPLHLATENISVVKELLYSGATIDHNAAGLSPVSIAAYKGQLDSLKELLAGENRKFYNDQGNSIKYAPIHCLMIGDAPSGARASLGPYLALDETYKKLDSYKPLETLKYYLDEFPDTLELQAVEKRTPLLLAARYNQLDFVKELLERKANMNVQDSGGNTPLHLGLTNPDIVDVLLKKGATMLADAKGELPIDIAFRQGILKSFEKLIAADLKNDFITKKGEFGNTALHQLMNIKFEAMSGEKQMEMFEIIFKSKTNSTHQPVNHNLFNATNDNNQTPLHLAVLNNKVALTKKMIGYTLNINAVDKNGKTPLDLAIEAMNFTLIQQLLHVKPNETLELKIHPDNLKILFPLILGSPTKFQPSHDNDYVQILGRIIKGQQGAREFFKKNPDIVAMMLTRLAKHKDILHHTWKNVTDEFKGLTINEKARLILQWMPELKFDSPLEKHKQFIDYLRKPQDAKFEPEFAAPKALLDSFNLSLEKNPQQRKEFFNELLITLLQANDNPTFAPGILALDLIYKEFGVPNGFVEFIKNNFNKFDLFKKASNFYDYIERVIFQTPFPEKNSEPSELEKAEFLSKLLDEFLPSIKDKTGSDYKHMLNNITQLTRNHLEDANLDPMKDKDLITKVKTIKEKIVKLNTEINEEMDKKQDQKTAADKDDKHSTLVKQSIFAKTNNTIESHLNNVKKLIICQNRGIFKKKLENLRSDHDLEVGFYEHNDKWKAIQSIPSGHSSFFFGATFTRLEIESMSQYYSLGLQNSVIEPDKNNPQIISLKFNDEKEMTNTKNAINKALGKESCQEVLEQKNVLSLSLEASEFLKAKIPEINKELNQSVQFKYK